MTDPAIQQHAGIRTRVYLGGKFTSRDPVPIQLAPKRFEVKTRTSNLGMRVDRPFIAAGMPNVRNRRELTLPWADIREPGLLDHLDILAAIGQPFDLGIWKQEYDIFDGDGATLRFYLQRRLLLENVTPPAVYPDYPVRITVYDKSYLDPTNTPTELTPIPVLSAVIDATDPPAGQAWIESDGHQARNLWLTTVRLNVANVPPLATDCLVIAYLPLYKVLIDIENPRSYAQALVEPRSFRFSEFG